MVKKAGMAGSDLDEKVSQDSSGVDEGAVTTGSDVQGLPGVVHFYRHRNCSELPSTPLRSHHRQASYHVVDASPSLSLPNAGLVNLTNNARVISALSESVASGMWAVDHDRMEAREKCE